MVRGQGGDRSLSVKIPPFFRCPISLDVMKSPVSLCTGVTYDRASIQRWLETGNTTCPATMQPLNTTDLVPNLTLHRLITLWAQSGPARPLLSELRSSASDPSPALRKLAAFFDDDGADELDKSQLAGGGDLARLLASIIGDGLARLEVLEEALDVASRVSVRSKKAMASALSLRLDESAASLVRVLKEARSPRSQANAAAAIDSVLARNPESAAAIAERHGVVPLLTAGLDRPGFDGGSIAAINAGLSCLVRLSGSKRARTQMVRSGVVPAAARILSAEAVPAAAAEKAMKLMEAASSCREGREAICEGAGAAVPAILRRMMKVGREGAEAAVVVLWSTCHLFGDRRAQEAVEANGGLTRVLLLMQSDCSPAVREMAGDLLRMFRVGKKCCLVGYDTKTTHIMPF